MANLGTDIAETRTPIRTHKAKVLHQRTYEAMSYNTAHQEPEILQCNLRLLSIKLYQEKRRKL